jgi:hypothetical protein
VAGSSKKERVSGTGCRVPGKDKDEKKEKDGKKKSKRLTQRHKESTKAQRVKH